MRTPPPPCDRCEYCRKGWRRIHKDWLFEGEKSVPCRDPSGELVHLYPIMPTRTQLEL